MLCALIDCDTSNAVSPEPVICKFIPSTLDNTADISSNIPLPPKPAAAAAPETSVAKLSIEFLVKITSV